MNINLVHTEDLWHFTGDPFADAGGYALKVFAKKYPEKDILELIRIATDIYVDKWGGKLNTFFLNSKITQPSFDAQQKKNETIKYFTSLLQETEPFVSGFCRITGRKTKLFSAGRDNTVLTGSGKFVNFHHMFQDGIMLSKEAIIRMFFLPLGSELLQGKIAVIHSNNEAVASYFGAKCCKRNLDTVAMNLSDGVLHSPSNAPGTALFRYVDDVLLEKKELKTKDVCAILYLFSNFGASPELLIYNLSCTVFQFYVFTRHEKYRKQWDGFVMTGYRNSAYSKYFKEDRYHYSFQDKLLVFEDKKGNAKIGEEDYKYWKNKIYDSLLSNKSIMNDLLRYSKNNEIDFDIIKAYAIKIRKMKRETIEKIEKMADFIINANDEDGTKKAIQKLNRATTAFLLRRFILNDIVTKNYNEQNEIMISLEDYTNYLFPDTESWKEMRDVLLIAIYQKLHERKMFIEDILDEQEEEKEVIE